MTDLNSINRQLRHLSATLRECLALTNVEKLDEKFVTESVVASVADMYCHEQYDDHFFETACPALCDLLTMVFTFDLVHPTYFGPVRLTIFEAIGCIEDQALDTVLNSIGALCEDAGVPFGELVEAAVLATDAVCGRLRLEVN